jgi:16S rRNA (uracil1498-N3)-methyltransferase
LHLSCARRKQPVDDTMHRFFLPGHPITVEASINLDELQHQLVRVLRMQPGDQIVLLNGDEQEYLTELVTLTAATATGRVLSVQTAPEPKTFLTLYACVLKGDKMEWMLQKGTELGVSRFVPVISERTIVRPATKVARKYDRWRAILREAAEQSRRGKIPELSRPQTWVDAIHDACADGEPDTLRLIPWEEARQPSIVEAVRTHKAATGAPGQVELLIGPEGGISEGELALAVEHGWRTVTLGERILRAETAALAAVTILMSELCDMD